MEKRDEKLYEAGLVLGRKAAHEKYWKQARRDADEYGSSRGLKMARDIGFHEEHARSFACGYSRAIVEHNVLDFYLSYREMIDAYAKSFAEGYCMSRREAIRCGYKDGNEEEE